MDYSERKIIPRAVSAYKRGDYRAAIDLYQEAARRYGESLFSANLVLCQRALRNGDPSTQNSPSGSAPATESAGTESENDPTSAISRQLGETQALLEKYYTRCQDLERQLLESREGGNTR